MIINVNGYKIEETATGVTVRAPSGKQVASCLSVTRAKEIIESLNKAGIAKEKAIQDSKKKSK